MHQLKHNSMLFTIKAKSSVFVLQRELYQLPKAEKQVYCKEY